MNIRHAIYIIFRKLLFLSHFWSQYTLQKPVFQQHLKNNFKENENYLMETGGINANDILLILVQVN